MELMLKYLWYFSNVVFLLGVIHVECQEDSLRSALNAINRRQQEISDYPGKYDASEYGYPMERPDDINYMKPNFNLDKASAIERALADYIDEEPEDDVKKRISSSFRERLEEDKQKQLEEIARHYMSNQESDDEYDNNIDENYEEFLRELWEKYHRYPNQYERSSYSSQRNKRYYYPHFGVDSIGLRKRSRYLPQDAPSDSSLYFLNYPPKDEQEDEYKSRYFRDRKINIPRQGMGYSPYKRFPVSKRSSEYMPKDVDEQTHEEKRSTKSETDPRVAKDLNNLFNGNTSETPAPATTTKKPTKAPPKKELGLIKEKSKPKINKEETTKTPDITKEEPLTSTNNKPLQIKKKSINWSDYFGLDRRKKSENLDNEWLLERYHKAAAMATKRSTEYPLQSFRNHDEPLKKSGEEIPESKENNNDKEREKEQAQDKVDEMDTKLQAMEDALVDDALKFTGAHEGTSDPKEVQEVKDKVIARLAAAYSLEKMRNALGEYKLAVARERERMKQQKIPDDYFQEEKRASVARKQAIDEESMNVEEGDNNIKCAQGEQDCHEQTYKTPNDILERHLGKVVGKCPIVEKACNEIGIVLGHSGYVLQRACNLYQMCLICSSNSWFAPTRRCNVLYLSKADELCEDDADCKKEARVSLRTLLQVSRSIQSQSINQEECDAFCPDISGDSQFR